jgi:hypothetical protein
MLHPHKLHVVFLGKRGLKLTTGTALRQIQGEDVEAYHRLISKGLVYDFMGNEDEGFKEAVKRFWDNRANDTYGVRSEHRILFFNR